MRKLEAISSSTNSRHSQSLDRLEGSTENWEVRLSLEVTSLELRR